MQKTLRLAYFLLLMPVMWGLIWQTRGRSVRVLACMAAPWVLMFALVPQMHERYLVWGAVASAGAVALGVGGLLWHLGVTFFAFVCIGCQILNTNPGWWPAMHRFFQGMIPHGGWGVLVLAVAGLVMCLGGGRRSTEPEGGGEVERRNPASKRPAGAT